jgi:hypothetical protein
VDSRKPPTTDSGKFGLAKDNYRPVKKAINGKVYQPAKFILSNFVRHDCDVVPMTGAPIMRTSPGLNPPGCKMPTGRARPHQ